MKKTFNHISFNEIAKMLAFCFLFYAFPVNASDIKRSTTENSPVTSITQQSKTITGTITDTKGMAVIGANVIVKGTTNGSITDLRRKFQR